MSSRRIIGDVDCKLDDSFIIVEQLRNELQIVREENYQLTGEKDQLNGEKDQLNGENALLKREILRLKGELSHLSEDNGRLTEELSAEKVANVQAQSRIHQLEEGQHKSLKEDCRSGQSSIAETSDANRLASPSTAPSTTSSPPKAVKRLKHNSSSSTNNSDTVGETDSGISRFTSTKKPADNALYSYSLPPELKPGRPDDEDCDIFIYDSDDDDDIIILPDGGGKKTKSENDSYERKRRLNRLDSGNRMMVMGGNRANAEEKKIILDFMNGTWKYKSQEDPGLKTILVSEGNETLQVNDGEPKKDVYVETFFELNYVTGKLRVRKLWKEVPDLRPLSPPTPPPLSSSSVEFKQ